MKHETVKLNGADVRMYTGKYDTWYVLADVASALQVSTNGIKRNVDSKHRCLRPVSSAQHPTRTMIHVNRRGLLEWATDGTSRLAMQKKAVVAWLEKREESAQISDLSQMAARESFADASTVDPVIEVPHASCDRLPDELKRSVAKSMKSTASMRRGEALLMPNNPEIPQETFLRCQIAAIDSTLARFGSDSPNGDAFRGQRKSFNDELEYLTGERVPLPQPEIKTINWRQFWSDEHGGISLRALVDAGLYSRQDHAVRALLDSRIEFSPVEGKNAGRGRPSRDYILTLTDAQRFCARANTPTGLEILDLMLEHHNEYQALLSGDVDAANRLASNIRRTPDGALTQQAAMFLKMCQKQDVMDAQIKEVQQKVKQLEDTRERPQSIDEYRPSALARMAGWTTKNGKAHGEAVTAVAQQWGAEEGVHYRSYRERNPNSDDGGEYVSTLYTEEFKRVFLEELREGVQQGQSYFAILRPMKRAINVHCIKHVTEDAQKST